MKTPILFLAGALLTTFTSFARADALSNGLVSYYKEDFPNSHLDSARTNHGIAIGTVSFTSSGKLGSAYTYNGNNSDTDARTRAFLPNVQSWNGGTISVWVRPVVYASNNQLTVAQVREATNWGHLWLYINPSTRKAAFHVGTGQGFSADATNSMSIADNTWYHLVATWNKNNNTAQLYVNGNAGPITTVPTWGQTTNELFWGAGFNGYGTNGRIDEIGVWNRALSQTEITILYNGGNATTYPFAGSEQRTFVVAFTGYGNAAPCTATSCSTFPPGHVDESQGITALVYNIMQLPGLGDVQAKAFTFYSQSNGSKTVAPNSQGIPEDASDHVEALQWLWDAGFKPSDRLIIVGHSWGGHRARSFAEQVTRVPGPFMGARVRDLVLIDPVDWTLCPGNGFQIALNQVTGTGPCTQDGTFRSVPVTVDRVKVYYQRMTRALTGYGVSSGSVPFTNREFLHPHTEIEDAETIQREIINLLMDNALSRPATALVVSKIVSRAILVSGGVTFEIVLTVRNAGRILASNIIVNTATLNGIPWFENNSVVPGIGVILPGATKDIILSFFDLNSRLLPGQAASLSVRGRHNPQTNGVLFGTDLRFTLPRP